MSYQREHISQLWRLYIADQATPEQVKELLEFLKDPANDATNDEFFRQAIELLIADRDKDKLIDMDEAWESVLEARESLQQAWREQVITPDWNSKPVHRVHFLKTSWFRYAAAVIILLGSTAVWYTYKPHKLTVGSDESIAKIQPGTNKAVLTIGNRSLSLSNNKTGIAVGSTITYNDGERIANADRMLTLSTPRGGQYQATLPDGSRVWLNAESSIKFPSKFDGNKRVIEVTGEVYLEVAKNLKQPFNVNANGVKIEVLGTSFNVNAYGDENALKTTLVDGGVKVSADGRGVVLKPGQQAVADKGNLTVRPVDIGQALAWRNGQFVFAGSSLETLMKEIARWYDIEVVYEGSRPVANMRGTISRHKNINEVLNLLELTETVHFTVEGRKVIVKSGKGE